MKRICSYYDEKLVDKISEAAIERGFLSLSNFQKYCTLLYIGLEPPAESDEEAINLGALLSVMKLHLRQMPVGQTFFVASLAPETQWCMLSRSQKITLALQLKKYIQAHDEAFEFTGKILSGSVKQYKKIKPVK